MTAVSSPSKASKHCWVQPYATAIIRKSLGASLHEGISMKSLIIRSCTCLTPISAFPYSHHSCNNDLLHHRIPSTSSSMQSLYCIDASSKQSSHLNRTQFSIQVVDEPRTSESDIVMSHLLTLTMVLFALLVRPIKDQRLRCAIHFVNM